MHLTSQRAYRMELTMYQRMIEANLDFRSKFTDEQISLAPAAQEQAGTDAEHAKTLQRLESELDQRKVLQDKAVQLAKAQTDVTVCNFRHACLSKFVVKLDCTNQLPCESRTVTAFNIDMQWWSCWISLKFTELDSNNKH
jgi:hypothetical protein